MPVPPNTLRVQTEYVLIKSVGPKVLWAESRMQGTGENFPPLLFHAKNVEVEIGDGAIYCLISPSYFILSPVWCSRPRSMTGILLAPCHDELRGPRLTTSDWWH
ncbi:uncharacterized protein TNCV_1959961 [Trichonephila clavipes]|nr:uncharacterized protein TNCV_1959961 [Trichonephila clavipes]